MKMPFSGSHIHVFFFFSDADRDLHRSGHRLLRHHIHRCSHHDHLGVHLPMEEQGGEWCSMRYSKNKKYQQNIFIRRIMAILG